MQTYEQAMQKSHLEMKIVHATRIIRKQEAKRNQAKIELKTLGEK